MSRSTLTPGRQAWARFTRNRRGYWSLWLFGLLLAFCLPAELVSNDKPLLVSYEGRLYFPVFISYPETAFGGDFATEADYQDPYLRSLFNRGGNWQLLAPNPHGAESIDFGRAVELPAPPSAANLLGTDDRGRDVLARLIYGFRLSVLFAFLLTVVGTAAGILIGGLQGYRGGTTDILLQRLIEIWGAMPELYLLIIFASIFQPSIALLIILLSLFSWMGLSDYVRAEFLKSRNLDYVRAARALGVSGRTIFLRHLLPNSMVPVVTFLPFRLSAAILALTSLDFLGLGVPPGTPSLGELLAQGKANIDAWWISLAAFGCLVTTMMLLIFIGEALRDSFDARRG